MIQSNRFQIVIIILLLVMVLGFFGLEWQIVSLTHQYIPALKKPQIKALNASVTKLEGDTVFVKVQKSNIGYSPVTYDEAKVHITPATEFKVVEFPTQLKLPQSKMGLATSTQATPEPQVHTLTFDEFKKEAVNGLPIVIGSDEDMYSKNEFDAKSISFIK